MCIDTFGQTWEKLRLQTRVRVEKYLFTGSSKHKFACIPMATVRIDTNTGYL